MKALTLTAPSTFEFGDAPTPQPARGQVLVDVKACGICGSDLHGMDGRSGRRIPPIIGLADDGWTITQRSRLSLRPADRGGDHGYDPYYRSMHGLFIASGPLFRRGAVVPAFENIHVYELMCRALGLTPAPNDGDPALASWFLAR